MKLLWIEDIHNNFTCPNEVQEKKIQMWINEMTSLPYRMKALTASPYTCIVYSFKQK
ncbi:hypothetical protein [Lysinibacillus sp. SGAir0095]|uniref:hypothetical protein n=1 Tax=Lysinibacillus sp. SGAir0095 TaxID=2070463 RepID=UPI00143E0E32|nr:hypothetical protein [Lysinibacillus sp. SGAir0095]